MEKPTDYKNEQERLIELDSYSILDTLPEESYNQITAIASQICETPISLISLIDNKRQWFKSNHGIEARETPKEFAFCAHAIHLTDQPFIVEDARKDNRFHDNPLVTESPFVTFYAGIPLISENGLPLGTLCVIDNKPKQLSPAQITSLKALSQQTMSLLELRKKTTTLEKTLLELKAKNSALESFAKKAAYDLKSPLSTITAASQVLKRTYSDSVDERGNVLLDNIYESTTELKKMIDQLLK